MTAGARGAPEGPDKSSQQVEHSHTFSSPPHALWQAVFHCLRVSHNWQPFSSTVWGLFGSHSQALCGVCLAAILKHCVGSVWQPFSSTVWGLFGSHHQALCGVCLAAIIKHCVGSVCRWAAPAVSYQYIAPPINPLCLLHKA